MNPFCWNLIVKYNFLIYLLAVGCFLCELGVITQCSVHVVRWFDAVGRQAVPWGASVLSSCLFLPRGMLHFHLCRGFFNHLHGKCLWEGGRSRDMYVNVYTSLKMLQSQTALSCPRDQSRQRVSLAWTTERTHVSSSAPSQAELRCRGPALPPLAISFSFILWE